MYQKIFILSILSLADIFCLVPILCFPFPFVKATQAQRDQARQAGAAGRAQEKHEKAESAVCLQLCTGGKAEKVEKEGNQESGFSACVDCGRRELLSVLLPLPHLHLHRSSPASFSPDRGLVWGTDNCIPSTCPQVSLPQDQEHQVRTPASASHFCLLALSPCVKEGVGEKKVLYQFRPLSPTFHPQR